MPVSRRGFLATSAAALAFSGFARAQAVAETYRNEVEGYGPLVKDPAGLLDLPQGFSYRIVSAAGEEMDDGFLVPHRADGMACFPAGGSKVVLMRNHELRHTHVHHGPLGIGRRLTKRPKPEKVFDVDKDGYGLPGGVTRIVYDLESGKTVGEHLALTGTSTNCAGGATPWGSWLTCEETTVTPKDGLGKSHGWVFEVPAKGKGLVDPVPLTDMGRFNHEAAAVDPRTGIIYLTEDAYDHFGAFYRFLPNDRVKPSAGGRLQALGFRDAPQGGDARNYDGKISWKPGDWKDATWIDLTAVDSPDDDLRLRAQKAGAAIIGRGEGIHFGDGELFFTATMSGPDKHGQVLRYVPSPKEGQPGETDEPGRIQLFVEPSDDRVLDRADNLVVAPSGHLIVCEDRYSDTLKNHLRGITPDGKCYTLARNAFRDNAELAGVCFAPDGRTMFVNIYWPGITLAITGPWESFKS